MKLFLSSLLTFIFITSSFQALADEHLPYLTPYAKLLEKHVETYTKNDIEDTGIDYMAWQANPLHEEAVQLLLNTDTSLITSKEDKMAFWINAYNLLTIDLIVKQGEQETIHNLGGLVGDPWNEFSWNFKEGKQTLGTIHQQVLRTLGEPRIHFALTCAAVSCPNLKTTPYWRNKLYTQLEKQTSLFLKNKKKGLAITKQEQGKSRITKKDTFKPAEMFQWFKNDFDGGDTHLFISRYIDLKKARQDGYLKHDWALNALTGKEPKATTKPKI